MRDNVTSGSVEATSVDGVQGGGLGWRGSLQRAGGGIAMDGGLHWIRPVREVCPGRTARIRRVLGVIPAVPDVQQALAMEGETLGHALLEVEHVYDDHTATNDDTNDGTTAQQPPHPTKPPSTTLIATYSCCLLANPAPMAHDACPYLRITGTAGELIVTGTGLQKTVPRAGTLRLYNAQYPHGHDVLVEDHDNQHNNNSMHDTHFFHAFGGLWSEFYRIIRQQDTVAAHETVVRAADDVRVVLALYASATTGRWEET
jgi:predicted dehydrogenase